MTTIVETTNGILDTQSVDITGTGGDGYVTLAAQASTIPTPASGVGIFSDSVDNFAVKKTDGFSRSLSMPVTADRTYTVPDTGADAAFIMSIGTQSVSGALTATNLSGTNTGDITLTAVGSSSNANGATLVGQALTLEPASNTEPGILTAGFQNIGGSKTIWGTVSVTDDIKLPASSSISKGNILMGPSQFIHAAGTANTFMGLGVGNYSLGGTNNVSVGTNTATGITTGSRNIIVGSQTGGTFSTASDNVILGYAAGLDTTQCVNCVVVGSRASGGISSNDGNTVIGKGAGFNLTTGASNIMLGKEAGITLTTGNGNIYIGADANTSVESNATRIGTSQTSTFVAGVLGVTPSGTPEMVIVGTGGQLGSQAITSGITTAGAIGVSPNANAITITGSTINLEPANGTFGGVVTTGTQTFAGNKTFSSNLACGGNFNLSSGGNIQISANVFVRGNTVETFIGNNAGGGSTFGTNNTMVGGNSGSGLTLGFDNTLIGTSAGSGVGTGNYNVVVGSLAGNGTSLGGNNVIIGAASGQGVNGGGNHVCIGYSAGVGNTSTVNNVCIGRLAGSGITSGTNNVCIGDSSGTLLSTGTNNILIRHSGSGAESDTTRIGTTQTACYVAGVANQPMTSINLQLMACDTATGQILSGIPTKFTYNTQSLRITPNVGTISSINGTYTSPGAVLNAGGIEFTGIVVMQIGRMVIVEVPAFVAASATATPTYYNLTFTPGVPAAIGNPLKILVAALNNNTLTNTGDIRSNGTNLRFYRTVTGSIWSTSSNSGLPSPVAAIYFTT